jgi:2-haloacid dehalogenase
MQRKCSEGATGEPVETIVFDLGGVLIDWNPDYVFDELFGEDTARKEYFYQHICTPDWNEMQDAGRPLAEATAERIGKYPDWAAEIAAFYGQWEKMLGGAIEPTVDVFRKLRQCDYRFYALTNWSSETFPIAQQRFELLTWFDGIVVSGVEKTRKPFTDFFEILFSRYDINPQTALFIDDNARNVAASRELGMRAIHFLDPADLPRQLAEYGVELPS